MLFGEFLVACDNGEKLQVYTGKSTATRKLVCEMLAGELLVKNVYLHKYTVNKFYSWADDNLKDASETHMEVFLNK